MRESWASMGLRACSVADRRTVLPPSPGCMHVIGTVEDFVKVYPHPLPVVDSHPTCGFANCASSTSWSEKIINGSMLTSALQMAWMLCLGDRAALEHTPPHTLLTTP